MLKWHSIAEIILEVISTFFFRIGCVHPIQVSRHSYNCDWVQASCSLECVAAMAQLQTPTPDYPHLPEFTEEQRNAATPARAPDDDGGQTVLQYDPVSYHTFRNELKSFPVMTELAWLVAHGAGLCVCQPPCHWTVVEKRCE